MVRAGAILEQSYVQPICTPTRSALMTGRYPIHTGRQSKALMPEQPDGLSTQFTLMPEYLKRLGYHTHMVGKWHLGFCNESYLPTRRGFDSYYGYWTGSEHYYDHTRMSSTQPRVLGYDFRDNEDVAEAARGQYSAHLFAQRAQRIIGDRVVLNKTSPIFLYLAFQSVHSPLEVPEHYEKPYLHIKVI